MNKNTRIRHSAESPVGGDVNRRSFLKLTGAGLVAALPISTAPWAGPAAAQSTQSIKREAYVMKTRKLGSLEVSEIGFGNMTLSGGHYGAGVDRAQGIRQIREAHERGVTFFAPKRWGGPIEEIRPGDVVWFSPGEKHWHGAAPTTTMTHIAIQEKLDGKPVDWLEHVTPEQYEGRSGGS